MPSSWPVRGRAPALRTALHLWATATTGAGSHRRGDLLRAKRQAAADFFSHCGKLPGEVRPTDVEAWRKALEGRGFKPATVRRDKHSRKITAALKLGGPDLTGREE